MALRGAATSTAGRKRTNGAGNGRARVSRAKVSPAPISCAAAFRQIATACVAEISAAHDGCCRGDGEAIHRMRVAITRLRSAATFFAPMTADDGWTHLKVELRWLNRTLGPARDVDVIRRNIAHHRYRKLAANLSTRLDRSAQVSRRAAKRALQSPRFARFISAATAWIEHGPWTTSSDPRVVKLRDEPLNAWCERKVGRWQAKLIVRGAGIAGQKRARLHRLRIRAKRLRYILEALGAFLPPEQRARFNKVKRSARQLQRSLGNFGDLEALRDYVHASTTLSWSDIQPHGFGKERKAMLADATSACRKMARAAIV